MTDFPSLMIPEQLLDKYRVLSRDRIARAETAWIRLVHLDASSDEIPALVRQLQRELHTIKGDSAIVGMRDIQRLAHHLEDLVKLAERHGFAISQELELVVITAMRALALLLRPDDQAARELDLAAVEHQIAAVLARPA